MISIFPLIIGIVVGVSVGLGLGFVLGVPITLGFIVKILAFSIVGAGVMSLIMTILGMIP